MKRINAYGIGWSICCGRANTKPN